VDLQLGELLLDVQAGLAKAVRGAAATGDNIQVRPGVRNLRGRHPEHAVSLAICVVLQ
jgi:hypothetical protein